nr:MAG TPA: hypothetical protein [Caudoviricetes sp.]
MRPRSVAAVVCSHVPVKYLPVKLPVNVPPVLSSLPSNAVLSAFASNAVLSAFLLSSIFITLFYTGLVDESDSVVSTIVLFASLAIPFNFILSAADISPFALVVATDVPAFPDNAE